MSQRFKLYDRRYSHLIGTVPRECSDSLLRSAGDLFSITFWKHRDKWKHPAINDVTHAVYEAIGYDRWQRFRVALKGWSTQQKLYFLEQYWEKYCLESCENMRIERIRVNNYIGALKRGGVLNADLQVVR